jgi:hypothetical protein
MELCDDRRKNTKCEIGVHRGPPDTLEAWNTSAPRVPTLRGGTLGALRLTIQVCWRARGELQVRTLIFPAASPELHTCRLQLYDTNIRRPADDTRTNSGASYNIPPAPAPAPSPCPRQCGNMCCRSTAHPPGTAGAHAAASPGGGGEGGELAGCH